MAVSTREAVKAFLEAQVFAGVTAVHLDTVTRGATYPLLLVRSGTGIEQSETFSQFDDPEGHVSEEVVVEVWQQWRDESTESVVETDVLPDAVALALKGARLTGPPMKFSGIRVTSNVPLPPDRTANIRRRVITLEVDRELARS
jgi:hypothetical protein